MTALTDAFLRTSRFHAVGRQGVEAVLLFAAGLEGPHGEALGGAEVGG